MRAGLDVGSGIAPIASSYASIELNSFGLYETRISPETPEEDLDMLGRMSAMCDMRELDESELAAELFGSNSSVLVDDVVGRYSALYAGHVREGDFRAKASSGGCASWLLVELLRRNLIDGVLHIAPSFGGDGSLLFDYAISRDESSIRARSKSQYYPAELSRVLGEALNLPGRYAVVGIPSIVYEIRLACRELPLLKERLPYVLGLVCGHQKSTRYVESFGWQAGISPGELRSFDFRVKNEEGFAWNYRMAAVGARDGEPFEVLLSQEDLVGSDWGHGFFKAKFSDYTDDAFNETADVVFGDAWLPEYERDASGNNIVIVRNPDLQTIFEEGIAEGRLDLVSVDVQTIRRSQRGLINHTRGELPWRLDRAARLEGWAPSKRVAPSHSLPLLRRLVQRTRLEIAGRSHVTYARARDSGDMSIFIRSMRPLTWRYSLLYRAIFVSSTIKTRGVRYVLGKLIQRIRIRR
ncbi:MAG: hypothetical protein BGO47_07740 [Microbacterium sp. 67-17]|nr:MAG: hypothetical protein BGO47_07740 [Microbacterium sp. 67-17]